MCANESGRTYMILPIINTLGSLAGTWLDGKVETQKAKVEVAKKVAAGEMEWNQTMASASASSWKDEWLTILVSIPLILALLRLTACLTSTKQPLVLCLPPASAFNS